MNIAFIGHGNMAQAIIHGMKLRKSDTLTIASPSQPASASHNRVFTPDNTIAIERADVVVLCVKPTMMAKVLTEIGQKLPQHCVLVSIAAGTTINWIQGFCRPSQAIVRCMPNTPIAAGQGATPLCANAAANTRHKQRVERIFKPASILIWLDKESEINAYTALSGSGPAYVFLFIEAMVAGAQQLGLTSADAQTFTLQTLQGALSLLKQSQLTPAELRKKVTSPGGTTEAALSLLQQNDFEALISKAMHAACQRAEALGR